MRAIVDVTTGEITIDEQYVPPAPTLTKSDVNSERDRRILNGKAFSISGYANTIRLAGDEQTQRFLAQRGTEASIKVLSGQPDAVYYWRDEDDFVHVLTAQQMADLADAGAKFVESVVMAAWTLKDDPNGIPEDYSEDYHWPS